MANLKEKTISYRRAEWLDSTIGVTLEHYLREVHKRLKDIDKRTIVRGGQLVREAKYKNGPNGGLLIHLTVETPGEAASVVPHAAPGAADLNLTTVKPPEDGEWLDGDAFLFVSDDHVSMCTTGIRDGAITFVLHELFVKAKLGENATKFLLTKVADISKLKLLQKQGVSELEIRATLYKATAHYQVRKNTALGGLGAVGKFFKQLGGKPHDVTPDGLRVYVGLWVDRRFTKEMSIGYKEIEALAADVVKHSDDHEEDYVIVTKTGQKISPKEIFMKTTVSIDAHGKTIQVEKAWKHLITFFESLVDSGALEE